jgi:hypothetical protein
MLALTAFALLAAGTLHAAPVIYEPFAGEPGALSGQAAGTGLTGTWSAEGGLDVSAGSMSWGSLATSGNRVFSSSGNYRDASVSTGTTLSGSGLLDDGAVLWFSALANSVASGRSYLTIGTGKPDGFDRIGGTGGFGVGIRLEKIDRELLFRTAATGPPEGGSRIGWEGVRGEGGAEERLTLLTGNCFSGRPRPDRRRVVQGSGGRGFGYELSGLALPGPSTCPKTAPTASGA